MRQTHELVKDAIRYHVNEGFGEKTFMSEYDRNNLADKIVDRIDPDGNLECVTPYTLQRTIGERSPNVRLGDLIKDMVRRELWDATIREIDKAEIDKAVQRNDRAGQ